MDHTLATPNHARASVHLLLHQRRTDAFCLSFQNVQ